MLNTLGFGLEVVRSSYREGFFFLFVLCTSILNMLICYTLILRFALERALSLVQCSQLSWAPQGPAGGLPRPQDDMGWQNAVRPRP